VGKKIKKLKDSYDESIMKEFSSRRENLGKSVRYENKIPRII